MSIVIRYAFYAITGLKALLRMRVARKDNENEDQDEEECYSEAADSDGDAKTEGTEVEGEEVSWSDVEDTPSALVASAHPINVQHGKSQNEAQGCPTISATRTTSEYSKYLST